MNTEEAVELLKLGPEGVREWNRRKHANESIPSLAGVDLAMASLARIDFDGVDLRSAQLSHTNLGRASLVSADMSSSSLSYTDFRAAELRKVKLVKATLNETHFVQADLSGADLTSATGRWPLFIECNLSDVCLELTTFEAPQFRGSFLVRTNLAHAIFIQNYLGYGSFENATIRDVNLEGADFGEMTFGETLLATNLSQLEGLDRLQHSGPSQVTLQSLSGFRGELPERFLKGCGFPDEAIADLRIRTGAIQFYSCFISYSTEDNAFATRLHNDLQAAGIRCWKWDHDARTGNSLWSEIDRAIRIHDKLVLIASASSLKSPQVNREIERAIRQEDQRGTDILFPVRLDDYVLSEWKHERRDDVVKKVIADARGWDENATIYNRVRDRLVKDLQAGSHRP